MVGDRCSSWYVSLIDRTLIIIIFVLKCVDDILSVSLEEKSFTAVEPFYVSHYICRAPSNPLMLSCWIRAERLRKPTVRPFKTHPWWRAGRPPCLWEVDVPETSGVVTSMIAFRLHRALCFQWLCTIWLIALGNDWKPLFDSCGGKRPTKIRTRPVLSESCGADLRLSGRSKVWW